MGTETNWVREGRYEPVSDAQMSLWRTMACRKPYLLLMNTNYDTFTPEMVEKYFQRSLFYGIFPSMFSHNAAENPYWRNPNWYNRDRPLFKKYVPLVKSVAEAGWQPVTGATCDNPGIFVERFGPDAGGAVYLTLMNERAQPQKGTVTVDTAALGLNGRLAVQELVLGTRLTPMGTRIAVSLQPQETWVVQVSHER